MKIERLDENKIKVTLTEMDLINLNIDVQHLEPNSQELHTFLFHIMETIREKTDFNPYSGQVVVEATPLHDGISILVSRLKENKKQITREQFVKISSIKAKRKTKEKEKIFYFDKFDDLCLALKALDSASLFAGELYRMNNTYCFIMDNNAESEHYLNIMIEFSVKQSEYPLQREYIKEHWQLVAKGRTLFEMTENIRNLT